MTKPPVSAVRLGLVVGVVVEGLVEMVGWVHFGGFVRTWVVEDAVNWEAGAGVSYGN